MKINLYYDFLISECCLNSTRKEKSTMKNLKKKTKSLKLNVRSNNNELLFHISKNIQSYKKLMLALLFTTSLSKHEMKIKMTKIYTNLKNLNRCSNIRLLNKIKKEILIDFFTENTFYGLIYIFIIKLLSRSIFIVKYFSLRITLILIKRRNELSQKNAMNLI